MSKIIPSSDRIYELFKYDQFWHRYDGKVTEEHDKALCGRVFEKLIEEESGFKEIANLKINEYKNYKCDLLEKFKDLPICPDCLQVWHERTETEFEKNQLLGRIELSLWEENAMFIQMFIENEGYDKLNKIVNEMLFEYLEDNDLVDKLEKKVNQKTQ